MIEDRKKEEVKAQAKIVIKSFIHKFFEEENLYNEDFNCVVLFMLSKIPNLKEKLLKIINELENNNNRTTQV